MKPKFWLERWQSNQIGFHQAEHNKLLLEFWPALGVPDGARVFVPLCGKSLDMRWLAERGHSVLGVELAEMAVNAFFQGRSVEQGVVDRFVSYRDDNIEVLLGDFFDLSSPLLDDVAAVFDRGSLIALPPDMRFRYADHLLRIVPDDTRILLLTLEYDQQLVPGPPHAVSQEEVMRLFADRCSVDLIESFVTSTLPPHFQERGLQQAVESVYAIRKTH